VTPMSAFTKARPSCVTWRKHDEKRASGEAGRRESK
jgi:hypothetical protein